MKVLQVEFSLLDRFLFLLFEQKSFVINIKFFMILRQLQKYILCILLSYVLCTLFNVFFNFCILQDSIFFFSPPPFELPVTALLDPLISGKCELLKLLIEKFINFKFERKLIYCKNRQ